MALKRELQRNRDMRFMEIAEKSNTLREGHYSLKLPFKDDVSLLNNFSVVKQRLFGLKKKFLNNEQFYEGRNGGDV